jgi:hypothetical protein
MSFKVHRGLITEGTVEAHAVVVGLDVFEDHAAALAMGGGQVAGKTLGLECAIGRDETSSVRDPDASGFP